MNKLDKLTSLQQNHMNSVPHQEKYKDKICKTWFDSTTVDFWRHERMYKLLGSFAHHFNKSKWLTVGDGRFGLDSQRLKKFFNINALPSDLSENMLKLAYEDKLIEDYSVENMEALSFDNDSFDIVFCKEAFHHCPRPMVALYEMIRVAKDAVVLIEPKDDAISHSKRHSHEPCGNYVYTVSTQEVNKVVHGLDLKAMAYIEFNDVYIEGCEFEEAEESNQMYNRIKNEIMLRDSSENNNMCVTIIFKHEIDKELKHQMMKQGYKFPIKVDNPYIVKKQTYLNKNNQEINNAINFSKNFNKLFEQLTSLQENNEKFVIYGNGTLGKTIQTMLPDKIVDYVDINEENKHPKELTSMNFDKVLVTVLGREESIVEYLVKELNIPMNKIITIDLTN